MKNLNDKIFFLTTYITYKNKENKKKRKEMKKQGYLIKAQDI